MLSYISKSINKDLKKIYKHQGLKLAGIWKLNNYYFKKNAFSVADNVHSFANRKPPRDTNVELHISGSPIRKEAKADINLIHYCARQKKIQALLYWPEEGE